MAGDVRSSLGMMSERGVGGLGLCHMASHMPCSCLHVLPRQAGCLLALCSSAAQLAAVPGLGERAPHVCLHVSLEGVHGCLRTHTALLRPPRCFSTRLGTLSPLEVPLSEAWALHGARGREKKKWGWGWRAVGRTGVLGWLLTLSPCPLSTSTFLLPPATRPSPSLHTHTLLLFSVSY